MQALLEVILPVFLVLGSGYVLTLTKLFPDGGLDGLMKFATNFAVPCLLFAAIARLDLTASYHPGMMVAFYAGAVSCFSAGLLGARFLIGRPWEDSVAIGFCCLFSNSVLLGLPITERAFGAPTLAGTYAIVSIHAPLCYGIGITAMEIVRNRGGSPLAMARATLGSMFKNALVIGIILGFAVNLGDIPLPGVIWDALDTITRAALPTALFALGGILVRYRPEGDAKAVAMVCAIALLLHPAIAFTLGTAFDVPTELFRSAVLTAAMTPGFNAYIFANMYGVARRVAATSVLVSTALSICSIWLWILVLS